MGAEDLSKLGCRKGAGRCGLRTDDLRKGSGEPLHDAIHILVGKYRAEKIRPLLTVWLHIGDSC